MSFDDTSFQVVTPAPLRIRHYEITTKHPMKFTSVEISADKTYFIVKYTYNSNPYTVKIECDHDEVEITYCMVSNDQYTILSDVKYELRRDSEPNRITVDFEKILVEVVYLISNLKPVQWRHNIGVVLVVTTKI